MTDRHYIVGTERFRRASHVKQQVYYALESIRMGGLAAKAGGYALLLLIILNAAAACAPASGTDVSHLRIPFAFVIVSSLIFCVEYLLRLWIADITHPNDPPAVARTKYVLSPMGLVDLLSFLPTFVSLLIPGWVWVEETVRVLRLFRLIKIARYMRGMRTIEAVIRKCSHEIVAAFMVIALFTLISSVLMYEAERIAQPDTFTDVFTGIYWALTTITSTGYGDLAPITPIGRIIGSITMVLSIAFVAIPSGIFSAGFIAEFRNDGKSEDDEPE